MHVKQVDSVVIYLYERTNDFFLWVPAIDEGLARVDGKNVYLYRAFDRKDPATASLGDVIGHDLAGYWLACLDWSKNAYGKDRT
jgi:hypothetical protein